MNGVGIIEEDNHGDIIVAWRYPNFGQDVERIALERRAVIHGFSASKYENTWLYMLNVPKQDDKVIASFTIVITASDYHVEKYGDLIKLFAKSYLSERSPIPILALYLSVLTGKKEGFDPDSYDVRASYLAGSLSELVEAFGVDSILLWTALMCNKRIVVFGESSKTVLKIVRTLPLLVWHRQMWDQLRPLVLLSDLDAAELEKSGVYIAGAVDPKVLSRDDLFDVYVDVSTRTITVSDGARNDLALESYHHGVAKFMLKLSESDEVSDQEFIKQLAGKTKKLISKLDHFKGDDGNVSIELIRSEDLSVEMQRFLQLVAVAEHLV